MLPDRDAVIEQSTQVLTESNTDDKAVDLMYSRCSVVQQESRPGELCKQRDKSTKTLLAQKMDHAFSNTRDLGNGWWLFCGGPDWILKAHVSYEGISFAERAESTVRDLCLPADHAVSPEEFRSSLRDFLQQFRSLPRRWGWAYEPITEDILCASARWQEHYLLESNSMPTHTHNEATVVAASLRCLAISDDIKQISGNWSLSDSRREEERYYCLADVDRNPRGHDTGIRPSVEVWRLSDEAELPDSIPQDRERLPQILRGTIQMAQRLLHLGRPQDWPCLFYVLCILLLVNADLEADCWTEAIDGAARETKKTLRKLCRLFHHTTRNMQPLSSDFDIESYAVLVDDDELAVEHYGRMHRMWAANANGDEGGEDASDLWRNLNSFAHGMIDC